MSRQGFILLSVFDNVSENKLFSFHWISSVFDPFLNDNILLNYTVFGTKKHVLIYHREIRKVGCVKEEYNSNEFFPVYLPVLCAEWRNYIFLFQLENDVANYLYINMMWAKAFLKLGVVPHKFECQGRLQTMTENRIVVFSKRKFHELLQRKKTYLVSILSLINDHMQEHLLSLQHEESFVCLHYWLCQMFQVHFEALRNLKTYP